MAKKSRKINPPRFRPVPIKRENYFKSLEQRPVSATKESSEAPSTNGTDQIANIDYTNVPKPDKGKAAKPINWERICAIISGIVIIIGLIATAVYKYTVVERDIDSIKKDIKEIKDDSVNRLDRIDSELRKEMRHLNDRIDNYLSDRQSSKRASR